MNCTRRIFTAGVALSGVLGFAGMAGDKGKANHHNGAKLLGAKIKTNGKHVIDKKDPIPFRWM